YLIKISGILYLGLKYLEIAFKGSIFFLFFHEVPEPHSPSISTSFTVQRLGAVAGVESGPELRAISSRRLDDATLSISGDCRTVPAREEAAKLWLLAAKIGVPTAMRRRVLPQTAQIFS
ncbi:hypothetical protein TorRG33x02_305580, partial [Trema orientale]